MSAVSVKKGAFKGQKGLKVLLGPYKWGEGRASPK